MPAQWFIQWWNLIFIVPFLLAVLYLGLYTVSGLTFGDTDTDADTDLDHDADIDHDPGVDTDADADADADADTDAEADTDADHDTDAPAVAANPGGGGSASEAHLVMGVLTWLGLGKVPVSILLMVLLLSWGAVGFVMNQVLWLKLADRVPLASMPIAAVASLLLTRTLARTVGRYLPTSESYAHRRHELLGSVGETIYPVDSTFGMVAVRDSGNFFQVPCRVGSKGATIAKGQRVVLVGYNRGGWFTVAPYKARIVQSGQN